MCYERKRRGKLPVFIVLCLSLLLLSLSGCGGAESATDTVVEDAVHLTREMPETAYQITATIAQNRSSEEQYQAAQQIAEIMEKELDPANIMEFEDGTIQFGTVDGGLIEANVGSRCFGANILVSYDEWEGRAKQIDRITIADDTDLEQAYPLGGESYTIGEAVAFALEFWQQNLAQFSFCPEAQAERVIVYEKEDGSYIYAILLDHVYEGMPFEQYSTLTQTQSEAGGFHKSNIIVELDAPGHVSGYSDQYPLRIVSAEPIAEPLLTEQEAIARAQEVMANYAKVSILETQLCYAGYRNRPAGTTDAEYNAAQFVYRPYWCLVLEWGLDENGNYYGDGWTNYTPNVTLYVDAVTGKAYLLDSISYNDMEISD